MSEPRKSQRKSTSLALSTVGFALIVVGLGAGGTVAFLCLGLAIVLFIVAIVVALLPS